MYLSIMMISLIYFLKKQLQLKYFKEYLILKGIKVHQLLRHFYQCLKARELLIILFRSSTPTFSAAIFLFISILENRMNFITLNGTTFTSVWFMGVLCTIPQSFIDGIDIIYFHVRLL